MNYQIEIDDNDTRQSWLFNDMVHIPRVGETVILYNSEIDEDVLRGRVIEVAWSISVITKQYTVIVVVDTQIA